MAFDNDYAPNLVTENVIESEGLLLLTISEKITIFMQNLFSNYILPNIFFIIVLVGIIIFLSYRYKNKQNKLKSKKV